MDHLPSVEDPFLPVLEIQYLDPATLGIPLYDNHSLEGFSSFSQRVGWDEDALVKGKETLPPDSHAVAAFVQQWHFFGLLSAFAHHRISIDAITQMFTRQSHQSEDRVVSTRRIEEFLQDWRQNLTEEDLRAGSSAELHANSIILVTQRHVALYMSHGGDFSERHPMRMHKDISFSINALCVILIRAKCRVWPGSRLFVMRHSELILSRLKQSGWCPSDITMLGRLMTSLGMYFASLFPPRLQRQDHDEMGCDKDFCAIMNITEAAKASYRTVHVPGCDQVCGWRRVEEGVFSEMSGGEDLIVATRLVPGVEGSPQLSTKCVETSGDEEFVAISHVWAEGLGHTTDNALPVCQLARIQSLVDRITNAKGVLFWIDTLSVPQDWVRQHLAKSRQVAIRRMNAVYRNASAVLVLDAELMSVRTTAALEERLVRFVCSSWLRRLWTLNEAVLGRRVMLQFQDEAVDMFEAVFDRFGDAPGALDLSQTLLTEFAAFLWRMKRLRDAIHQSTSIVEPERTIRSGEKMNLLWNACQYRSTSEQQDEALCLAICLGHRVGAIASVGGLAEDNWCSFIDAQVVFPREMLFALAERVDRDGYRWAPKSCIRRPGSEMGPMTSGLALATATGLRLRSPGLIFSPPRGPLQSTPNFFWVHDDISKTWYRVFKSSKTYGLPWSAVIDQIMQQHRLGVVANHGMRDGSMALGVLVAFKHDISVDPENHSGQLTRFISTCNVMPEFAHVVAGVEEYHREELQSQSLKRPYCTTRGHLESELFDWTIG